MTDKKFTDEEIIKANDILEMLDFFNQRAGRELWNEKAVAVQNEDIRVQKRNIKFLRDLINRQKAEVERYKRYYYRHEYDKWEKKIKTEAYKEFAERLKEKTWDVDCRVGYVQVVDMGDINETLKEIVGKE